IQLSRLRFKLVYDTVPDAPMAAGGARPKEPKPQVVGPSWSSNLHRKVVVQAWGHGALVARGDGHTTSFSGDGYANYFASPDSKDRLFRIPAG
ncbi:hypothetical protein, partial [Priestia megaterium]|uniref:hypothetical protein n=1 Tax=Priestia megaterium TaxID=1404 RepID=UPI0035B69CBC